MGGVGRFGGVAITGGGVGIRCRWGERCDCSGTDELAVVSAARSERRSATAPRGTMLGPLSPLILDNLD